MPRFLQSQYRGDWHRDQPDGGSRAITTEHVVDDDQVNGDSGCDARAGRNEARCDQTARLRPRANPTGAPIRRPPRPKNQAISRSVAILESSNLVPSDGVRDTPFRSGDCCVANRVTVCAAFRPLYLLSPGLFDGIGGQGSEK